MRSLRTVGPLVALLCSCTDERAPTKISIDVSQLALSNVPVRSAGLLVISEGLADAAVQQDRVASEEGEAISATPPTESKTDVSLTDMMRPARGEEAPKAAVATPETATAQTTPPMYFPITLDEGATTFTIDVPSGPKTQLFLYGFGAPPADGSPPIPVYTAAALNVALVPGGEQTVTFAAYPSGVVVPQVLKPTTLGLVDAENRPIEVPTDLSCLSVAHADSPRADFPADLVAKIRVGTVSQAVAAGAASVLVLPVGSYKLSCFAQFAGKLFAVNPPLSVRVEQGKITVASGSLVKIKDLVIADAQTGGVITNPQTTTTPGTTVVPGSDTSQNVPAGGALPPRFSVHLLPVVAGAAGDAGSVAVPTATTESNFDDKTDMQIAVFARLPDGSVDTRFSGQVSLRVTSAFDHSVRPNDKVGGAWSPFQPSGTGAPTDQLDVVLIEGSAMAKGTLRLSSVQVPAGVLNSDAATMQLILSVHPSDASGALLRPWGARLFTVRRDLGCRDGLAFDNWFATTLTEKVNELSVKVDPTLNKLVGLREHILLAALTAPQLNAAPSRCVFVPRQGATTQTVFFVPVNQASRDKITPLQPFILQRIAVLNDVEGYVMNVTPNADGQAVLFDAIAPAAPSTGTLGSVVFSDLGYTILDSTRLTNQNLIPFKLSAVVR